MLRHHDSAIPISADGRAAPSRSARHLSAGTGGAHPAKKTRKKPHEGLRADLARDVQAVILSGEATFAHPCAPLTALASGVNSVTFSHIECVTRWAQKGLVAPPVSRSRGYGYTLMASNRFHEGR